MIFSFKKEKKGISIYSETSSPLQPTYQQFLTSHYWKDDLCLWYQQILGKISVVKCKHWMPEVEELKKWVRC